MRLNPHQFVLSYASRMMFVYAKEQNFSTQSLLLYDYLQKLISFESEKVLILYNGAL